MSVSIQFKYIIISESSICIKIHYVRIPPVKHMGDGHRIRLPSHGRRAERQVEGGEAQSCAGAYLFRIALIQRFEELLKKRVRGEIKIEWHVKPRG